MLPCGPSTSPLPIASNPSSGATPNTRRVPGPALRLANDQRNCRWPEPDARRRRICSSFISDLVAQYGATGTSRQNHGRACFSPSIPMRRLASRRSAARLVCRGPGPSDLPDRMGRSGLHVWRSCPDTTGPRRSSGFVLRRFSAVSARRLGFHPSALVRWPPDTRRGNQQHASRGLRHDARVPGRRRRCSTTLVANLRTLPERPADRNTAPGTTSLHRRTCTSGPGAFCTCRLRNRSSDTIVVFDRSHAEDPRRSAEPRAVLRCGSRHDRECRLAERWILHMPVRPTISGRRHFVGCPIRRPRAGHHAAAAPAQLTAIDEAQLWAKSVIRPQQLSGRFESRRHRSSAGRPS